MKVLLGRTPGIFGRKVYWQDGHAVVVGDQGSGAKSRIFAPVTFQVLKQVAEGGDVGLTVFDHAGVFARDIERAAHHLQVPSVVVDQDSSKSAFWNPLEGDTETVAEAFAEVVSGDAAQEPFFQEKIRELGRNMILLLKRVAGDGVTLHDVAECLGDDYALREAMRRYSDRVAAEDQVVRYLDTFTNSNIKRSLEFSLVSLLSTPRLKRIVCSPTSFSLLKHVEHGRQLLSVQLPLAPSQGRTLGELWWHSFERILLDPSRGAGVPHILCADQSIACAAGQELLMRGRARNVRLLLATQEEQEIVSRQCGTRVCMADGRHGRANVCTGSSASALEVLTPRIAWPGQSDATRYGLSV